MAKVDVKNTFWLAIPVTAAIWLTSWLFGLLKIGVTPLFSTVNLTQTITPTLGNKIYGFISGYLPLQLTLPNIAILLISSWATLILGSMILGMTNWSILGKGNTGRLASAIFLGGVPIYLLLVGFQIPSLMVFVGALIWILVVSYVAGMIGGLMKKNL